MYNLCKRYPKPIDNIVFCDKIIITIRSERVICPMRSGRKGAAVCMASGLCVGAVIPAAGLSSRMGRFKPLLPFGKTTVIEATVSTALSVCRRTVVILGKRSDELQKLLARDFGERLLFAENPGYASTDMLTSVQLGLRALGECDAFFLVPADMPLIARSTYETLIDAFDGSAQALIPAVSGRRGHPPLIAASLIPEILAYRGEGGLRAILSRHHVREIAVEDRGCLADLDTPRDYEELKKQETIFMV